MHLKSEFKILWILFAIALVILLKEVWMIAFLGILFCVIFSFPVNFLNRFMARGPAVLITLVLFLGGGGGLTYLCAKPLADQVAQLDETAPQAIHKMKEWFSKAQADTQKQVGGDASKALVKPEAIEQKAEHFLDMIVAGSGKAALGFGSALSAMIVIIVLAAFFSHEPKLYYEGLKALVPKEYEEDLAVLWKRLSVGLRHWVGGILISMSIMAAVTAVGLIIAGIQDWPLLATFTFFGTFIPYVGALASAVPGLMLGLAQSGHHFLMALIVYVIVHLVEGYIVEPVIMRRAVIIQPAILLLWQLTMGALGGILGIIVATPLLVCLKIVIGYLYIEKSLGKTAAKV